MYSARMAPNDVQVCGEIAQRNPAEQIAIQAADLVCPNRIVHEHKATAHPYVSARIVDSHFRLESPESIRCLISLT